MVSVSWARKAIWSLRKDDKTAGTKNNHAYFRRQECVIKSFGRYDLRVKADEFVVMLHKKDEELFFKIDTLNIAIDDLYSVKWCCLNEIFVLCLKYVRYLHKTSTVVFTSPPLSNSATFHLYTINVAQVGLFVYVIYSLADQQCLHV